MLQGELMVGPPAPQSVDSDCRDDEVGIGKGVRPVGRRVNGNVPACGLIQPLGQPRHSTQGARIQIDEP